MIDDEGEARAVEQRNYAVGVRRIDRVGEPDVADARVSEHFRLTEFRAADANGAAVELPTRDDWALVRLGVRTKANAARIRRCLHAIKIAKRRRLLDQDRRGP